MFRASHYRKPFLVALVLLLLGIGLIVSGAVLEAETKSMDFYALIAFGIFLLIAAAVTYGMYGKLEREYRRSFDGRPLLRYRVDDDVLKENIDRRIRSLKATNRGLLMVMLFFCVLFGFTLPLLLKDGQVMAFICLGLAAFLFLAEKIVTGYRIGKLRKSANEFLLTEKGAVVGGEFHCWALPGASLIRADFQPSAGAETGLLTLEYAAEGRAGTQTQKLLLPVPKRLEPEIPAVLDALRRGIG